MKRYIIISSICLIVNFLCTAAQEGWTYYKYKDLPLPGIMFCIQSDYSGGVYLGLTNGLIKHNGYEWIRIYYNELDPKSGDNKYNIRRIRNSNGYVWAGTNNGIIRFLGYEKKHYNPDNTPSMPDDKTRGIAPDKYGDIWFLNHSNAISKLDISADTVVNYTVPSTVPLPFFSDACIFNDAEDNLWFSAEGKFVKFSSGTAKVFTSEDIEGLDNENVNAIQIMQFGNIAIITGNRLILYKDYNGSTQVREIDIPDSLLDNNESFEIIKIDLQANLWILSRYSQGGGIGSKHFYKYSSGGDWTKYTFPKFEGIQYDIYGITDLTIDENGKVWFTDPQYGVYVFNPALVPTSADDNLANSLTVIPNPAGEFIEIISVPSLVSGNQHQVDSKIKIYNLLGEIVLSAELTGKKSRIDIRKLASGKYFLNCGNKIVSFIKN